MHRIIYIVWECTVSGETPVMAFTDKSLAEKDRDDRIVMAERYDYDSTYRVEPFALLDTEN